MTRKKKQTTETVNSSDLNNLNSAYKARTIDRKVINEEEVLLLQRAVGPDLLALALEQAGAGATLEQVQTKLKELIS